jgi:hypothetical protein
VLQLKKARVRMLAVMTSLATFLLTAGAGFSGR